MHVYTPTHKLYAARDGPAAGAHVSAVSRKLAQAQESHFDWKQKSQARGQGRRGHCAARHYNQTIRQCYGMLLYCIVLYCIVSYRTVCLVWIAI